MAVQPDEEFVILQTRIDARGGSSPDTTRPHQSPFQWRLTIGSRPEEARALLRALLRAAAALPARPVGRKVGANVRQAFRARACALVSPAPPPPRAPAGARPAPPEDAWQEDGKAALRLLIWLGSLSEVCPIPSSGYSVLPPPPLFLPVCRKRKPTRRGDLRRRARTVPVPYQY